MRGEVGGGRQTCSAASTVVAAQQPLSRLQMAIEMQDLEWEGVTGRGLSQARTWT